MLTDHRQHGKGAIGVLGQPPVAHSGKAPQALEGEKRVLNLGAHGGLTAVGLPVGLGEGRVAVGALVGEVPGPGRVLLHPLALGAAAVGAVPISCRF